MQITFNIPDAQVPRIADWIRSTLAEIDEQGNPVQYTNAELLAEFKRQVQRWIKGEVQQHELLEQHKAIFANYTQIDVTD